VLGAALTGLVTGLSLIVAIGAQNAFVLRQGLARQHVVALQRQHGVGGIGGAGAAGDDGPGPVEVLLDVG